MKTTKEKLYFTNNRGERLTGYLDCPVGESPRAYALYAHCFTCTKNIITATRIGAALAGRGVAVFRFDFAGLGESEGDFPETNLGTNIDDLVSAYRFLRENYRAPTLAIGHSLGGAALIVAADKLPDTRAIVTIAVPDDPAHLHELLREYLPAIEQNGDAEVMIGGSRFRITHQFMDDIKRHNLVEALARNDKALLIMHSAADQTVGIDHAYKLFESASGNKSFVSLGNADHLLSKLADAEYTAELIFTWSSHYW